MTTKKSRPVKNYFSKLETGFCHLNPVRFVRLRPPEVASFGATQSRCLNICLSGAQNKKNVSQNEP